MLTVWKKGDCRIATLAAAALLLASCATDASNYRPATSEGGAGYTDKPLSGGHYLVTFTGGQNMDLAEVRRYLRRRSAEVTVREDYSHFVIFDTRNEAQIHTLPPVDYWNPEHGYLAGYINPTGSLWTRDKPGAPHRRSVGDSSKTTRYTAHSEIILLKGEQAAKDPDAQSASEVLDGLASDMPSAPAEHLP